AFMRSRQIVQRTSLSLLRTSLVLVASVVAVAAAPQTKGQISCILDVNHAGEELAVAIVRDAAKCVRDAAEDRLPPAQTVAECLALDGSGKIARARVKVGEAYSDSCTAEPDYGTTDAQTVQDAFAGLSLTEPVFGLDADGPLALASSDEAVARCQIALVERARARVKEQLQQYRRCSRESLRSTYV